MSPVFFDAAYVRKNLSYQVCIEAVRDGMKALSAGTTRQLLRSMISMGERRTFGIMPGALGEDDYFGAKLIAVFPAGGVRRAHRGVVVLFEPKDGYPVCVSDAEEITRIRTAAASAVATDVLARSDAATLLVMGTGHQCFDHVRAISKVRDLQSVVIWGRSEETAKDVALQLAQETGLPISATSDAEAAASEADIICTVTGASQPILFGSWVRPGTHVNIVGSSGPGPVEIDNDLVLKSRFVADSRASVLAQGAEFLVAKQAGLIGDEHVVAEIGDVLLGKIQGRSSPRDITIYKSLGHAVQDLAAVAMLYQQSIA